MTTAELVRAWKDRDFRLSLTDPVPHPAGDPEREVYVGQGLLVTCAENSASCSHFCSCG